MGQPDPGKVLMGSSVENSLELAHQLGGGQTGRMADLRKILFVHKGGMQQVFGNTQTFIDLLPGSRQFTALTQAARSASVLCVYGSNVDAAGIPGAHPPSDCHIHIHSTPLSGPGKFCSRPGSVSYSVWKNSRG